MEGGKEEEGRAGEKRGREEREREKQRGWGEEAKEEEGRKLGGGFSLFQKDQGNTNLKSPASK